MVRVHKHLSDCIVVSPMEKSLLDTSPKSEEVIVDIHTGQSALRGSHIFAPGVMGLTHGSILHLCIFFKTYSFNFYVI